MHHPSHFIELNFLANHFIADGHGPVQFIQRVGQPEMTWPRHFIQLNFLASHFIKDGWTVECEFLAEWQSAMPSIGIASQRCACYKLVLDRLTKASAPRILAKGSTWRVLGFHVLVGHAHVDGPTSKAWNGPFCLEDCDQEFPVCFHDINEPESWRQESRKANRMFLADIIDTSKNVQGFYLDRPGYKVASPT